MSDLYDGKSEQCITFISECLERKTPDNDRATPLFLGLNGAQGSGKTTLVSVIAEKLRQPPHSLTTIVLSIDDLYLTHENQRKLAASHPNNPLLQHRGQPSSHDLPLARSLFSDLLNAHETKIPSYDKSAYEGQGDRSPHESWNLVNREGEQPAKVVIFEGWCVGFRALPTPILRTKWENAVGKRAEGGYCGRLGFNRFEDVEFVNEALREYDHLTNQLDGLIHLDALDPACVYLWRQEQETALHKTKKSGMTDEQVKRFVDGYYPAYELYTDGLRRGIFNDTKHRQLRLVIGEDRRVKKSVII